MLKGQDIIVLLKLSALAQPPTVRALADQLGFDPAGTHRAMRRLGEANLYSCERRHVHEPNAEECLVHAVKFLFPAKWESEVRGIPTSWAALPLAAELAVSGGLPPVWPHAEGKLRGLGIEPLHPIVPAVALADTEMHEWLSLIDALRSGEGPRVTQLAERLLKEKLDVTRRRASRGFDVRRDTDGNPS